MRRALAGLTMVASLVTPPSASALSHFGLVDTGELFVSADGGASWSILSTLPVRDARALVAGATSSELFLASRSGSFYKSDDAGMSWSAISAVPASDVAALVPYPGRLLLFTASGGVYASLDAGESFSAVGAITASDIAGAAPFSTSAFAVSRTGGVYRSDDGGVSWSAVGAMPVSNAVGIAAFANQLYVLTSTGDVARSDDLGASWSFVSTLSQSGTTALHGGAAELLASTGAGEVAASADGIDWTWRGTMNQLTLTALASDEPNPTAVGEVEAAPLVAFALGSNPARGAATLLFTLERAAVVTVTAYDVGGREVGRPIAGEHFGPGRAERHWRPGGLAGGVYFLRARIGGHQQTQRLVWLRGS